MPGIISQPYPYFEPGFPLRSAALNQLVKYGEGEERRAHFWLTGSGCIYGLTVELNATGDKLVLKKGVGITSLGYLIVIDHDFELGRANTPAQLSTADFYSTSAEVVFSQNGTATTKTGDTTVSMEPLSDALELTADGASINFTELIAKNYSVVLLVALQGNRSETGCQNCDKSLSASLHVRALLLSKDDLKKIDDVLGNTSGNVEKNTCKLGLIDTVSPEFVYIERFKHDNINNVDAYIREYQRILISGLTLIKYNLGRLQVNDTRLKNFFGKDLPLAVLDKLKEKLGSRPSGPAQPVDVNFIYFIQYIYGFAKDLTNTYQELLETRFGDIINYIPPANCFPRHLILGSLVKNDPNEPVEISPQNRTPFFRPPYAGFEDVELEKAKFLYDRLSILLGNALFVDELGILKIEKLKTNSPEVRITPSAACSAVLSQQAIPYYYEVDIKLRMAWNFQLYHTKRWQSIHSYIRINDNPPFNKLLQYQTVFDRADFYRIEGLVGKSLDSINAKLDRNGNLISSDLHLLRKDLNLPFEIKLCTLQSASLGNFSIPLFSKFWAQHPGLEHQGGVPKGGTFVLVIAGGTVADKNIIGDFCLPYYTCCEMAATIVEFIVESPNNFTQTVQNNIEVYEFPVRYTGAEGKLHIYFKNLSQNAESFVWRMLNPVMDVEDSDLAFDHEFIITGDSTTYDLTLTAREGGEDVVSITKKIILTRAINVPVIAEFVVESPNDFVQTRDLDVEVYTFPIRPSSRNRFMLSLHLKNISQHADTYFWQVDAEARVPDADLALTQEFEMSEEQSVTHEIKLFASRADQPEVLVTKRIVLERVVEVKPLPVIAEFIVESPNDFVQTREGDVDVYAFSVKPSAVGSFVLPLHLKNISQHADTYFWQVDSEDRVSDTDLVLIREFNVPEGRPVTYEIKLFASQKNQPEVAVVKRVVLERVNFLIDFSFVATDNGLASVESETTVPHEGIQTKKIFLRLVRPGIESIVTKWSNLSQNADTFHWEVNKLDSTDLMAESNAKTSFRPTLILESQGISSFIIVLEGTNTTKDLKDQKVILLDVLPPKQ